MKKKTTSRPLKFVYLFMVAVILFSMTTMMASAAINGNVEDIRQEASGYFPNGNKTLTMEYKADATSCYVYNDQSSCVLSVKVFGGRTANWDYATDKSYLSYGKSVPMGAKRSIMNWVYEDFTYVYGQGYAGLWVWTPDGTTFESIDYLWSPDSIGNYG